MSQCSGIVRIVGHRLRPTQWFTPTKGLLYNSDSVRATSATDVSGAPIPGPGVKINIICINTSIYLAFGEADAVDVMEGYPCLGERILDHRQRPFTMVLSSVSRKETFPRRCDVCMPDIRQDFGRAVRRVLDNAGAEFVRGSLEP